MMPLVEDRWRDRMERRANTVVFRSDPYVDPDEGERMEFRLTYEGLLLSPKESPSRTDHKHSIRQQLHPQLRMFWSIHPWLVHLSKHGWTGGKANNGQNVIDVLADRFTRSKGYKFVPLVREELNLICGIEILYLRPRKPGSILCKGDIDNKLKTLFDALKVPSEGNELPSYGPGTDEAPFFVLLEDDKLVTHLSVETDYLMKPVDLTRPVPDENDARVIITIRLKPFVQQMGTGVGNMCF